MTKYRKIIRLTRLGFSQRNIMASCGVAQKTVVKVQKRARELNLSWSLDDSITDTELQRLIRNAGFNQSEANIIDINYTSERKLNKDLINRLATYEYISEHWNLFITDATGCGKNITWHAHLVWKPANSITIPSISVCQTYLCIWTLLARREPIVRQWLNMPSQCFSF